MLGSASEMENQYLPVQHWRHWESVRRSPGITHIFSILGFLVDRVVSHGRTELQWLGGSKSPSAWWTEIAGYGKCDGCCLCKLLFEFVGHRSETPNPRAHHPVPSAGMTGHACADVHWAPLR